MGLFDKKYCDICGEKIGLLGNRKLEDGNLCKDCARKLSPFFSERRNSTVEDIRRQLAYRAENEKMRRKHRSVTGCLIISIFLPTDIMRQPRIRRIIRKMRQ